MPKLTQRLGAGRYLADEHYAFALQAFQSRNFSEALSHLEAAIAIFPGHAEYHALMGWIYHEQDKHEAAGDAYDLALNLNPYEMLANYGRGMLAYQAKDWKTSFGFFLNALAAQPDRAETQYYLALVSHRQSDNARALHWMGSAEQAFAKAGDERAEQCRAWKREFEKLIVTDLPRDKS